VRLRQAAGAHDPLPFIDCEKIAVLWPREDGYLQPLRHTVTYERRGITSGQSTVGIWLQGWGGGKSGRAAADPTLRAHAVGFSTQALLPFSAGSSIAACDGPAGSRSGAERALPGRDRGSEAQLTFTRRGNPGETVAVLTLESDDIRPRGGKEILHTRSLG
jgi:hypothetical protein